MPPCEQIQHRLPQFIADGEPPRLDSHALRAHLRECARCSSYAQRLRWAEEALRTWPLLPPDPALTRRILAAVAAEERRRVEWEPLPWNVWLPVLTLLLALSLFVWSLSPGGPPLRLVEDVEHGLINWSIPISSWVTSVRLETSTEQFWAIWIGFFATTAGIGLSMALTRWSRDNSRSLGALETQVADAVQRLLHPPRGAD